MDRRNRMGNDRNDEKDHPAMSRLFVLCSKSNTEQEFRDYFSQYGTLEEIWIVKDRHTGENKGVAYVKFSKTSEAAKALEEMHGRTLGDGTRPIKVLVASSRQQGSKRSENEEEKYLRLFIIIPKDQQEDQLYQEFGEYGEIDTVTVIRDKITREGKGFAYIKFKKFSHAALAFENCNTKYKAVFADPKPSRNTNLSENFLDRNQGSAPFGIDAVSSRRNSSNDYVSNNINVQETTLNVICSPTLNQDQLWKLFDIIPGLDYCKMNGDYGSNRSNATYATVVYSNPQSASYAREKLHGLEYPPGERLIVKFLNDSQTMPNQNNDMLLNVVGNGSNDRLRDSFCSVALPATQPMANSNTPVIARCFIVCIQQALPTSILRQAFCRFGDLIDVYLLPNKNCGYAKYASVTSAEKAIETLHGAEVCGIRLKVLEAEEPNNDDRKAKRMRRDD